MSKRRGGQNMYPNFKECLKSYSLATIINPQIQGKCYTKLLCKDHVNFVWSMLKKRGGHHFVQWNFKLLEPMCNVVVAGQEGFMTCFACTCMNLIIGIHMDISLVTSFYMLLKMLQKQYSIIFP